MGYDDAIALTFNRSGGDAGSVTVTAADASTGTTLKDVTASLVTSTHNFKTAGAAVTPAILCPDVNGNTSPTIELTLSIAGLPATFSLSAVQLDIHALNGSGAYQSNSDNKTRQWNVATTVAGQPFAALDNIDIAAGVGEPGAVHKSWTLAAPAAVKATNPLELKVKVTKGDTNEGCFFGLGGVTLLSDGDTPDRPVTPPDEPTDGLKGGIYNIVWKANTSDYMTERSNGTMGIAPYSVTSACFWEITPVAGKAGVYTVKNVATGNFIGSCNLEPSSASKIVTTETPVEYYIGKTSATAAEIAGCYWLSSTDCEGHSDEAAGPRALNKDGASNDIITWQAGTQRTGSYWTITEARESYELRPFTPSAAIGSPQAVYSIVNMEGNVAKADLTWEPLDPSDQTQGWYFVGSTNKDGYRIVNASNNTPLNGGARYSVGQSAAEGYYIFTDIESGEELVIDHISLFAIKARRTAFALHSQIYSMPCGTTGSNWITSVDIDDAIVPLHYPERKASAGEIASQGAQKPTKSYTMFTRSRATVAAGTTFTPEIFFGRILAGAVTVTIYNDWNRDGVFETSTEYLTSDFKGITVPADAAEGSSRMRIRFTDNGLEGADDEVTFQTLDLIVNVVKEAPAAVLTVKSSDPSRGAATTDGTTATATPHGTALFISWMEGNNAVSLEPAYTPELTRPMTLTAMFTPNLDDVFGGIEVVDQEDATTAITVEGRTVTAPGARAIALFGLNGAQAARVSGERLDASALAPGIYIAAALTPQGIASAKIIIE